MIGLRRFIECVRILPTLCFSEVFIQTCCIKILKRLLRIVRPMLRYTKSFCINILGNLQRRILLWSTVYTRFSKKRGFLSIMEQIKAQQRIKSSYLLCGKNQFGGGLSNTHGDNEEGFEAFDADFQRLSRDIEFGNIIKVKQNPYGSK